MRIMICTTVNSLGSAEELALSASLAAAFKEQGAEVDAFHLPYTSDVIGLPEQILAYRLLPETAEADLLVTAGYPACFVRHPNKVCFLFDMEPQIKELYKTVYGTNDDLEFRHTKDFLKKSETSMLHEARKIYCSSRILKRDLFGQTDDAELFEQPIAKNNAEATDCSGASVLQTNLRSQDRIELILEAVAETRKRLFVFIPYAEEMMLKALKDRLRRLRLEELVVIIDKPINTHAISTADLAVSIPFASRRIPSYILEAVECGTPVLTSEDSTALLEVVLNGKNGIVAQPVKESISAGLLKNIEIKPGQKGQDHEKQTFAKIVKGLAGLCG